jgi:hypothetical protein
VTTGTYDKTMLDCPCGTRIVGRDQPELLAKAREHLQAAHPTRDYSDEQILFVAY